MDTLLKFLAVAIIPFGLVIGWRLSPYFISSLEEVIRSRYEIWIKKISISIGFGLGPAMILWNLGGGDVFNKHGHTIDIPITTAAIIKSEKGTPPPSLADSNNSNGANLSVSAEADLHELDAHSGNIDKAASAELDVDKIVAEKIKARATGHPTCADILKREEANPGDNDLQCANFEFESADKELNVTYKSVRTSLPDERKAVLKSEQIAWIKDKESFCGSAADRSLSMIPRFREVGTNFCLADITRKRTEYLKEFR